MQSAATRTDVLIVGGGLAGLAAADALRKTTFSVTLLEAQDHFGGRTLGLPWAAAGRKVDMGGTWLLPGFESAFALLDEFQLETTDSPDSERWLTHFRDGAEERRFLDTAQRRELERAIEVLQQAVARTDGSLSASEAIRRGRSTTADGEPGISPLIEDWMHAVQRYLAGAPLEEIAAEHLLLDTDDLADPEHYRTQIVGTTASLVDALQQRAAASAQLRTETPVMRVERDATAFLVTTANGEVYRAAQLIVAMPLNRLHAVDWESGLLGDYEPLAEAGHAGTSFKDWLILDGIPEHFRVLSSHGPYGYFRSEERLADGGLLCVGLVADIEAIRDTDELELEIRKHYFPDAKIRDRTRHDWLEDPAISGTWMAPRPGQLQALQQAVTGNARLQIVGGDVDLVFPGTIEGALRSGRQAAQTIISNENG